MINRTWEPYGNTKCDQCKGPNDPYMIQFELWQSISKGDKFLCLGCVEERLGRHLEFKDFIQENDKGSPLPINFGYFGFNCLSYVLSRNG